ncbi:hypothetical protein BC332_10720 [Capsicum chinense]|nr:hypothetical protein BC332_10720 [Capsicum chinense]
MREDVVLCTIPIVGMGGLGKTAVAKKIFNDEAIEKHFEKRVWLCLPEMSETKSFLGQILESLTERKLDVQSRDIIVKKLRDALAGKKYLLVLDDLWRVDSTLWHEFMDSLRGINSSRGNCILVTTHFEFEKDQLIQLWMAEGFLHSRQETTVMEDVGNKFFQLLLQNSLLQDVEFDEHNNIKFCKMHDFVHELAGDILRSKLFDQKGDHGEKLSQLRYSGWDSPIDQIDKINEPRNLYTLFWRSNYVSEDMLLSFKFLRVLNLSSSGIKELSAKIGKLIYLRYLDLSNTETQALPNSICKLYNLQTFRVNNCYSLKELPYDMGNMINLRHIYCSFSSQMPLNMGLLTNLQTLQVFKVALEKG